jgi:hypothetical protein
MIEVGMMSGGTKRIQYDITKIGPCEYEAKEYEYYSKASRSFDSRPESQKPKWHYERKIKLTTC